MGACRLRYWVLNVLFTEFGLQYRKMDTLSCCRYFRMYLNAPHSIVRAVYCGHALSNPKCICKFPVIRGFLLDCLDLLVDLPKFFASMIVYLGAYLPRNRTSSNVSLTDQKAVHCSSTGSLTADEEQGPPRKMNMLSACEKRKVLQGKGKGPLK